MNMHKDTYQLVCNLLPHWLDRIKFRNINKKAREIRIKELRFIFKPITYDDHESFDSRLGLEHLQYKNLKKILVAFPDVEYLSLKTGYSSRNIKLTDEDLILMKNLKKLMLNKIYLTEDNYRYLKNIDELILLNCNTDDKMLKQLTGVKKLTLKNLTNISNETLNQLTNLEKLYLDGTGLTKINNLSNLKNLNEFILSGVFDLKIAQTINKDIKKLGLIVISSDIDAEDILRFENLEELQYFKFELCDKDFAAIKKCKKLKILRIANTKLSESDIHKLLDNYKINVNKTRVFPIYNWIYE